MRGELNSTVVGEVDLSSSRAGSFTDSAESAASILAEPAITVDSISLSEFAQNFIESSCQALVNAGNLTSVVEMVFAVYIAIIFGTFFWARSYVSHVSETHPLNPKIRPRLDSRSSISLKLEDLAATLVSKKPAGRFASMAWWRPRQSAEDEARAFEMSSKISGIATALESDSTWETVKRRLSQEEIKLEGAMRRFRLIGAIFSLGAFLTILCFSTFAETACLSIVEVWVLGIGGLLPAVIMTMYWYALGFSFRKKVNDMTEVLRDAGHSI